MGERIWSRGTQRRGGKTEERGSEKKRETKAKRENSEKWGRPEK
jgi:hypothetical protein